VTFPFVIPDEPYLSPGHYNRAALKLGRHGYDVWALQRLLNEHGHELTVDGSFGTSTDESVRVWQEGRSLVVDGVAGPVTQRDMVLVLSPRFRERYQLPPSALKGQLSHESGCIVGNHTARYSDGSYDGGIAQCNSRFHIPENQFDAAYSLETLAKTVRGRFDAYRPTEATKRELARRDLPVPDLKRRWQLAMGSWNRPAWTNWLAGRPMSESAKPSPEGLAQLEDYVTDVSIYVSAWPKPSA
jgi:peptidoglycan hydrolase-like protein with peptidoglycan-binding domain